MKLLVHQATDVCITEAEAVDQMTELVAEKTQAVALLNTHQKRLDDSIENSKEVCGALSRSCYHQARIQLHVSEAKWCFAVGCLENGGIQSRHPFAFIFIFLTVLIG